MLKGKNHTERSRLEQLSLRVGTEGENFVTIKKCLNAYDNLPNEIKLKLKKEIEELKKTSLK